MRKEEKRMAGRSSAAGAGVREGRPGQGLRRRLHQRKTGTEEKRVEEGG